LTDSLPLLICSPEIAKPNEYLAEIWGEMTDDETFASQQEFQEFLSLTDAPLEQPSAANSRRTMSLLLCYSRMTKTPLTATIRKCTLKDHIHPELRDKLILGISGAVPAIYRYFAP
jgi:hypothetical protein